MAVTCERATYRTLSENSCKNGKIHDSKLDPFWATRLWQHIVKHAQSTVKISRRRHYFKYYDNVFDGESLVTAVYHCLSTCLVGKIPHEVSRTNAVKVCQVLQNNALFESVPQKNQTKFEGISSKLYRFLSDEDQSRNFSNDKENDVTLHSLSSLKSSIAELIEVCDMKSDGSDNIKQSPVQKPIPRNSTFRLSTRLERTLHKRRNSAPITRNRQKVCPLQKSDVRSRLHLQKNLQMEEKTKAQTTVTENTFTEETHLWWRESALTHLLTLVDVPMLEPILSVPATLPPLTPTESHIVIENNQTSEYLKQHRISPITSNVTSLPWVDAVVKCLGTAPPGIEQLWSLQACKMLCYTCVVDYYKSIGESLIPSPFVCVCICIIELLRSKNIDKALLATKLLMMVLPWSRRQQLQSLLKFLHLVVSDIFVSVDRKVTNYEAVSRDFLDAVIQYICVSTENCQILFDFLIFRVNQIFSFPHCLSMGVSFCKPINSELYCPNTAEFTKRQLMQLAFNVMDSASMKLGEKKVWLKKLKKCHLEVHKECSQS